MPARLAQLAIVCTLLLWLSPSLAMATAAERIDEKYDQTGDKLVDAEDWKHFTPDQQRAYAAESLAASSTHLDISKDRVELYLYTLNNLYQYK
ncbi:MAG: hypothetical protein R8J84_05420 [Mariprofundales bacterium]